jgi:hypothetical protein
MRFLATTALVLSLPSLALADDFTLRADIAEALVYAQGAEVTRRSPSTCPRASTASSSRCAIWAIPP